MNYAPKPVEEALSIGGLALDSSQKAKLGRKYLLSKAHKQALVDVNLGKQMTIESNFELNYHLPSIGSNFWIGPSKFSSKVVQTQIVDAVFHIPVIVALTMK